MITAATASAPIVPIATGLTRRRLISPIPASSRIAAWAMAREIRLRFNEYAVSRALSHAMLISLGIPPE